MKYIKTFESQTQKNGYWVFEPLDHNKHATSKIPTNRYSKEEAIELFLKGEINLDASPNKMQSYTPNLEDFKEPYFKEEKSNYTHSFKDEESDNDFINWLRAEKGFERNESDLKYEYAAWELDYLYDEYKESKWYMEH